jgi:hypothetical protein
MTREEFVSQMTASEQQIRRRVIPLGFIYSMQLAVAFGGIALAACLFWYFTTAARNILLAELGICALLFFAAFPMERASRRRFISLAVKCPSCQSCLVFMREEKTLETGRCYKCGQRVFDV